MDLTNKINYDYFKKNKNVIVYIYQNYENVLKNLISKNLMYLDESQIYFFYKISKCDTLDNETKNIVNNIKKFFDMKKFNTSLFYEVSFEGHTAIKLLSKDNIKID